MVSLYQENLVRFWPTENSGFCTQRITHSKFGRQAHVLCRGCLPSLVSVSRSRYHHESCYAGRTRTDYFVGHLRPYDSICCWFHRHGSPQANEHEEPRLYVFLPSDRLAGFQMEVVDSTEEWSYFALSLASTWSAYQGCDEWKVLT